MTAHEVEAFRRTHDPGLLLAQAEPPGGEELPQPGQDDPFELPARTGQDHEVVGIADQPQVTQAGVLPVPWWGPPALVVLDQAQRPPGPVGIRPVAPESF